MNVTKPTRTFDMAALKRAAVTDLKNRTTGQIDAANPATPAALVAMVTDAVDAPLRNMGTSLPPADLAKLRSQVATRFALSVGQLGEGAGAAQQAATTLAAAARIAEREEEIFQALAKTGPQNVGKLDPKALASDLANVLEPASNGGAALAHDSWFALSARDTVQGAKNNDLGALGIKVRARPFMAPSNVILESQDEALIKTMRDNNVGGVKNALAAIVDAGKPKKSPSESQYLAHTQALTDPFEGAAPKDKVAPETVKFLQNLGYELSAARAAYANGQTPDWKKLPVAEKALSATHDRYIAATPYASDDQKVPFGKLSLVEQSRDVPALMAGVYGALTSMGALTPVP